MVNDELESIRSEAAITYSKRSSGICLDGLINTTEDRSRDGLAVGMAWQWGWPGSQDGLCSEDI